MMLRRDLLKSATAACASLLGGNLAGVASLGTASGAPSSANPPDLPTGNLAIRIETRDVTTYFTASYPCSCWKWSFAEMIGRVNREVFCGMEPGTVVLANCESRYAPDGHMERVFGFWHREEPWGRSVVGPDGQPCWLPGDFESLFPPAVTAEFKVSSVGLDIYGGPSPDRMTFLGSANFPA